MYLTNFNCGRSLPNRKGKMEMANRLVKIEYGVPKLSQNLAKFMASVKAKATTRHAINDVGVTENVLAVTDGRRLLTVTPKSAEGGFDPPIKDGVYHLTGEGFLLKKDEEEKFPKWREVIPKETTVLGNFGIDDERGWGIAKVISAVDNAGCLLNTKWLLGAIIGFRKCGCDKIKVEKQDDNKPILITAEASSGNLQYVQMPLSQ